MGSKNSHSDLYFFKWQPFKLFSFVPLSPTWLNLEHSYLAQLCIYTGGYTGIVPLMPVFRLSTENPFSLSYKTKDYCIQLAKPQPEQIGRKAPPPPFCLLVRYLARIVWHDITLPNCISCIIEHHIDDLAEKLPPHPGGGQTWKFFFRLDLSISCNFQQLWVQLAEKPPEGGQTGKFFLDWIYPFHAISSNFGFSRQKSPPPPKMGRDPAHITHGEYPWSPYYKSTLGFLLSKYLIGYQLCQLFKILTYTELQDTRSWCRWKAYRQPCHNTR